MAGQDFDWNDKDSVIIRAVGAVAVYLNQNDDVVIRQQQDWNSDEDSLVIVPRAQLRPLIEALQAELEDGVQNKR